MSGDAESALSESDSSGRIQSTGLPESCAALMLWSRLVPFQSRTSSAWPYVSFAPKMADWAVLYQCDCMLCGTNMMLRRASFTSER